MTAADAHRAILGAWRIEQPRLITGLARIMLAARTADECDFGLHPHAH
jgi:hypothetical protein